MPQVGQLATALPVLTLTLFGWKVLDNRWAGLLAGALAGLYSIFPAYYVNWSRYTQGLGLALLPVAWVLFLEVVQRPLRSTASAQPQPNATVTWQTAIRQSGPYMLGVIGAAGLFLTHYRIAMVYATFVLLYLLGRLAAGLWRRVGSRELLAPFRRTGLLALLSLAALSPWLVNLAQNFRTHLVGRDTPGKQEYYNLTDLGGLLSHWSIWFMAALSLVGVYFAFRNRKWLLLLAAAVWLPLALWSNPYWFEEIMPGFRLPFAGYLDVNTIGQSIWLPLALLSGYAVAVVCGWLLSLPDPLAKPWPRLWRVALAALMGVALILSGTAAALPTATSLDKKLYVTEGDAQALVWMRDNLPHDSYVLANPFAFSWAPDNIYGTDAGMWTPLIAGLPSSVPPLPAYNERLADPEYLVKVRRLIGYEPFVCGASVQPSVCREADWQALKSEGVTHIFVGSRGGALNVAAMLKSDKVRPIYKQGRRMAV